MNTLRRQRAWLLVCMVAAPAWVRADTVELENGDVLNGKVLTLDAKELKLQSAVLGDIRIPRERVASIHLGNRPATNAKRAADKPATEPAKSAEQQNLDNLLKQLQGSGVDAKTLDSLQDKLPLLAVPEVKQYFTEKVTGLMTGRLNIGDIRKDAIKVRTEILDLQKDLGPQGAALNGYLSILDGFLRQTEGWAAEKTKDAPPAKKTP